MRIGLLLIFFIEIIIGMDYHFPAVFECKHEAYWFAWPTDGMKEFLTGFSIKNTQMELFRILTDNSIKVNVIVNTEKEKEEVVNLSKSFKINLEYLEIPIIEHIDIWMRDFGPFFVVPNDYKEGMKPKILQFSFTNWGTDPKKQENYTIVDQGVSKRIADYLNIEVISSSPFIVSEGGDKSFNGKGILLVTESVELQRNLNFTKEKLEDVYKEFYGVKKVIWLPAGVVEDTISNQRVFDGTQHLYTCLATNGHNDEFCRFVGENTVLLSYIEEEEYNRTNNELVKENYLRLKKNFEILEKETDLEGKKLKVIKFPNPELEYMQVNPGEYIYKSLSQLNYTDGSEFPFGEPITIVLPNSYMNYIVSNGVVIVPQFYVEGKSNNEEVKKKDEQAMKILGEVFPGRKVYGLNPTALTIGGGAFNCISQQQPTVQCLK